ncbi:Uu.00g130840.m01.CDS01 [Anthostomella pinea]|uniref:Uu.00g130840.m01.CDS01 n=1 Tax=Anthostomella pinea TaxID=933095 RepID=A0AAI8VIS3_9PEZI|nr:Uu.00g130840.m01.CDS01 [Anthostomella pinea]
MHFLAALTLPGLASATAYSIATFAPGTVIDGANLQAAGSGFYTGISGPATYCPENIGKCPEVHGTLVYDGMTGMAVEVPGGQEIYVDSTGLVKYTVAHSAYIPNGAFIGGWFNQTIVNDCGPETQVDVLNFLANDGSNFGGLSLCPDIPDYLNDTGASYALYAKTERFNLTDCIDAIGLSLIGSDSDYGCWQYE